MPDEKPHSEAEKIAGYSYLHLFAHDGTISDAEISFLKKLALRDYKIDEHELAVLDNITRRISRDRVSAHSWEEIRCFRHKYGLPPLEG
jgi:uncharacterized tellurite resistance protein B-like protein